MTRSRGRRNTASNLRCLLGPAMVDLLFFLGACGVSSPASLLPTGSEENPDYQVLSAIAESPGTQNSGATGAPPNIGGEADSPSSPDTSDSGTNSAPPTPGARGATGAP